MDHANTKEMITEYRCSLLEEVMRKDWKAGSGMACAAARVHFSTRPGLAKKLIHVKKILKVLLKECKLWENKYQ